MDECENCCAVLAADEEDYCEACYQVVASLNPPGARQLTARQVRAMFEAIDRAQEKMKGDM
jgi:hypothetical protein